MTTDTSQINALKNNGEKGSNGDKGVVPLIYNELEPFICN